MNVTFNVKGYIDRRTPELKARYAKITSEGQCDPPRDGEPQREVSMVSRLGPVGPDRQGGAADSPARPTRIWPATAGAPFRLVRVR